MNFKLVSIIINNYNYGQFLEQAITSALTQSYSNIEVIVVDDGSTDDSHAVIVKYGDKVVTLMKENGGQASAFNAGYALSHGDIIVFLDADDFLFHDAVEKIVAAWQPDLAKLHYRLRMVDDLGNSLQDCVPLSRIPLATGDLKEHVLRGGSYEYPPTSGNAFSREALAALLPMPEKELRIAADGYLLSIIPLLGPLAACDDPLGAYRVHGKNRWYSNSLDISRLRQNLAYEVNLQGLISAWMARFEFSAIRNDLMDNFGHVRGRLASLRLAPETHPFSDDNRCKLIIQGMRATCHANELNWKKKLLVYFCFIFIGFLPRLLIRRPVAWMLYPSRPDYINLLRRLFK
jgi:glycosyltransferase involved in cell wall biosynthesis